MRCLEEEQPDVTAEDGHGVDVFAANAARPASLPD
jgi:hypothetical protein